jgi:hypothetical protein
VLLDCGSGRLWKRYRLRHVGESLGADATEEKRYSPTVCTGCKKEARIGNPDEKHISTSYIERQNLTMRMQMRGFTRLLMHSQRKSRNHIAAICFALHALQVLAESIRPCVLLLRWPLVRQITPGA